MRERRVTIDFETRSPTDITFGAQRYAEDPRTGVMCLAMLFPEETDSPQIWLPAYPSLGLTEFDFPDGEESLSRLFYEISQGTLIEAHNSSFERSIWEYICVPRFGWPEIKPEQWRCSASVAASFSLPRSLAGVSTALGLPEKDSKGHKLMLKLSKPRGVVKSDLEFAATHLFGDSARWKDVSKPKTVFQLLENLGYIKDESGYQVDGIEGPAYLNPWHEKQEELSRLFDYCKTDVMVEHAVSERLGEDLSEQELKVWQLDQTMNFRGIHLDMELVDAALNIAEKVVEDGNERIVVLTDGEVGTLGQRAKLLKWINAQPNPAGKVMENLQKETVFKALQHPEWWSEDAYEALCLRKSLSMTSTRKYQKMLGTICTDSRVRGTLYYHGTDTGRWAGRGIQPQNFPRGNVKADIDELCGDVVTLDKDSLDFLYGDAMEVLSSALRGAICAAPGSELVCADYAAIEARGIFWLAGDADALGIFNRGGDIYKEMAVKIYDVELHEVTKTMRQVGKSAILGLGYGMGAKRFKDQAATSGVELTKAECKKIVKIYREAYPSITSFWKDLNKAAIIAVSDKCRMTVANGKISLCVADGFLNITLPSGRVMHYYSPEVKKVFVEVYSVRSLGTPPWSVEDALIDTIDVSLLQEITEEVGTSKITESMIKQMPCYSVGAIKRLLDSGYMIKRDGYWQQKFTYMAVDSVTKKYARWGTFGGKLAENVTSGMCRDIMAEAMLRAEATGVYKPILTVHDEILCEVVHPKGEVEEFEALITESPLWATDFPIKAEGWKNLRYRK